MQHCQNCTACTACNGEGRPVGERATRICVDCGGAGMELCDDCYEACRNVLVLVRGAEAAYALGDPVASGRTGRVMRYAIEHTPEIEGAIRLGGAQ